MGAGTSRPRKFWVARAREVWRRDVSNPEVIDGVDWGWDVSSQKVFGCEGRPRRRDVAAPEGVDLTADDADGTDRKESERVAASIALSGTSDFARPVRRLPYPRNPRNPRSLLCWSRVGHPSWARRAAPQPSGFAVGCAGPQTTQMDAELSGASARTEYVRSEGGSLDELSFVAVESRSIPIHRD